MYDVTIIIPTYKEEANIQKIVTDVTQVLDQNSIAGEILVVDDNSPDNTASIVTEMIRTHPGLRLWVREHDRGLSQSVVDGFNLVGSDIFLVMDADLSHPPELIPKMISEIRAGNDLVIGSRYIEGGGIKKWPLKRRLISIGATLLGRLLVPDVNDPVSGFFAVRKAVVENAPLRPRGYKILLEILGKGSWRNAKEIPFVFVDREIGSSKLKMKTIFEYVQQVADITVFSWSHHETAVWQEWKKLMMFGLVGISGIIVNMGMLWYLTEYTGLYYMISSLIAVEMSILNNFLWNDIWTFGGTGEHRLSPRLHRLIAFQVVSVGGLIINMGILFVLTSFIGVYYLISNLIGILVGFGWNFILNRNMTWEKNIRAL